MPQARSSKPRTTGSKPSSSSKAKPAAAKRSAAAKPARASAGTSRASSSRASSAKATSAKAAEAASATAGAAEARLEAAAQRLRKLNERIIDAGRDAGETTLTNYEKALKTIASTLERGPGASDVEWVANLATAQAKFIRDVTTSWTAAARKMLK
jgi:ABC-2 type transport system ATP-binding protein